MTDCNVPLSGKTKKRISLQYIVFLISHSYLPLYIVNVIRISNSIKKYSSKSSGIFFLSCDKLLYLTQ